MSQLGLDLGSPEPTPGSTAVLSDDGLYRYRLGRRWADGPTMVFVMLNPSTADALVADPTIRKCIGFARRDGAGAIDVVNLWAYRSPLPADLATVDDPIGPENNRHLAEAAAEARASGSKVVGGWGGRPTGITSAAYFARIDQVKAVMGPPIFALDVTSAGQPWHPCYLGYEIDNGLTKTPRRPAPWWPR